MNNNQHLHYFDAVAGEGGIARAGERLHLASQPSMDKGACLSIDRT